MKKEEFCDGCCYRWTCEQDLEKCCYLSNNKCLLNQRDYENSGWWK